MDTLCRKDVINICDGNRIGYVCDLEVDTASACVAALLVMPDTGFSFFRRREPLRVCWCSIQVIGDATILVRCEDAPEPCVHEKGKWFGSFFSK